MGKDISATGAARNSALPPHSLNPQHTFKWPAVSLGGGGGVCAVYGETKPKHGLQNLG